MATVVSIRQTFSQRTWPGVGDIDDCWVLSAIQCANAVAPWLPLLTSPEFRAFAGDPDDGRDDGGNVADITKGARAAWPKLAPYLKSLSGVPFATVLAGLQQERPLSACVVSAKLPDRYGFAGLHQITVHHRPGALYVSNPLAPDRSKPTLIRAAQLEAAMLAYGNGKCYGVLFPTIDEAFTTHPLYRPADDGITQATVDAATRPLLSRIAAARQALEG